MPTPTATVMIPYHALDDLLLRGTRASQPAATEVVAGTLYSVTDEASRLERSDGTSWALYSPTGGAGGTPDLHHATHEPGGSDALVDAAWTSVANIFETDQTIDGDLFITGSVVPVTAAQRARINALVGDPTGARTLMSSSFVSGLSLRHDEGLGLGRIACGNYDTQTYQPLICEVESFQVHSGVSPAARVEHLRVHPSGGLTIGAGTDHDTDPGLGILKARGLDGTPLPLHAATHAPGGTDPITVAPAPPLPYYDYGEGTPGTPPADTVRMYAVDDSGFTFLEERDSAGRIIRTSRDTVAVGKVDEPSGISRGQVVYVSGAVGSNRLVRKALATGRATTPGFGLAMESGAQNAFIRILTSGLMTGLNTSAIAEGTRVFLSATMPGELTVTAPLAPNLTQRIGWVLRQHSVQGEIGVLPSTALSESSWTTTHASMHAPGGRDPLTDVSASWLTSGVVSQAVGGTGSNLSAAANGLMVKAGTSATTAPFVDRGTFTPTITANGGASGQLYTQQIGYYTRVGNMVTALFNVVLSVKGTFAGSMMLGGFPLLGAANTASSLTAIGWQDMTIAPVAVYLQVANFSGSVLGYLRPVVTGTSNLFNVASGASDIGNATGFNGQITYFLT